MKTARWFRILYLSFVLWLLLFPPWMESRYAELYYPDSVLKYRLGHHWRFSEPLHWQWFPVEGRSFYVADSGARIDYRLMLYEAAIVVVALALLFVLLSALEMPIRKIVAGAKVEISLLRARVRNWRNRDLKRNIAGARQ
jgi:hypothetical protein